MVELKSDSFEALDESYSTLLSDVQPILDDVVEHTKKARKAMDLDPVDANTLSNEIVELSILNQRLGDRVAKAGIIARATENHYKTVREEHKLRLVQVGEEDEDGNLTRMAAGVADSAKMKLSQDEFDLANAAEGLFDQLQYMRRSSDKTIDAIRSKLSFEKIDYKNS